MKVYRGVSKERCEKYKKKGIPKGENFTNRLVGAKHNGKCIIFLEHNKRTFEPNTKENYIFKDTKISERFFKNKKVIKIFKIK